MLKKLTENIYYLPQEPKTDRPVLGLIFGKDYSLIVDSGNSPKHARAFLKETGKMNIPPIKYVVLTHHHWDHVLGIQEFKAHTIAHEKTKEAVEKMKQRGFRDEDLEKMNQDGLLTDFSVKCIKAEIPERDDFQMGDINQVYKDSMAIDLGGVVCNLYHVAGSHTDDSTIIHIPQENVMFLGDCGYGTRFDELYGYDRDKLFSMIEKIEKYPADHYVLSHESLCDREEIVDFWKQLKLTGEVVGEESNQEVVKENFLQTMKRKPSEDEKFFLDCFINWNKSKNRR